MSPLLALSARVEVLDHRACRIGRGRVVGRTREAEPHYDVALDQAVAFAGGRTAQLNNLPAWQVRAEGA